MFSRNKGLITGLLLVVFTIANVTPYLVMEAYSLFWMDTYVKSLDGIFEKTVFEEGKDKVWLVWFYKHWCASCTGFAAYLSSAFKDMKGWSHYVRLGVVNCDNQTNFEICRHCNITSVGQYRVFQPYSKKCFHFDDDPHGVAKALKTYDNQRENISGIVNLKIFTGNGTNTLWNSYPEDVRYLVLVFESEDSGLASQLALDISKKPEVRIRPVDLNNTNLYQLAGIRTGTTGFAVQERKPSLWNKLFRGKPKPSTIYVEILKPSASRDDINTGLRRVLIDRGVNIKDKIPESSPYDFLSDGIPEGSEEKAKIREKYLRESLKVPDLSTVVLSYDLQTALYSIFTVELAQRNTISGEPLKVLKDFVTVISKYFPATEKVETFFREFKERIFDDKESITGANLNETFVELGRKYNPFMPKLNWLACRGLLIWYRGYPCGVWTLFHTLVASEDLKKRNTPDKKPEALNAVLGYVKHFYSCSGSDSLFDLTAPLNTTEQAVLWLWNVHNGKNPLAGHEDFPTTSQCAVCYINGVRNHSKVFTFLSNMYTNIIDVDQNIFNNFYNESIPL